MNLLDDWLAPRDSIVARLSQLDVGVAFVSSSAELREIMLREETLTDTGVFVHYAGYTPAGLNEIPGTAELFQQWLVWTRVANRQEDPAGGLEQPDGAILGRVMKALLGFRPTGLGPLEIASSPEAINAPGALYYPSVWRAVSSICAD